MMDVIGLITDSGGPWGYVARGTHDKQKFLDRVVAEYEDECSEIGDVRHSHARVVPAKGGQDFDYVYLFNQEPGHGVFEVTYIEI